jgi:hypothetical protein
MVFTGNGIPSMIRCDIDHPFLIEIILSEFNSLPQPTYQLGGPPRGD